MKISYEAILVGLIAMFIFLQSFFNGDEAYKYVNPYLLFWIKAAVGSLAAAGLAIKAYMSTGYSDFVRKNQSLPPATPEPEPQKPAS